MNSSTSQQIRVPLTIVTGLLGGGKSTLLKYIMKVHHGKRIAIIMNEFGDTQDIEKSLFVHEGALTTQEWLELKNGCLCCSIKDTGVQAIESLMQKKGSFDFIILETTGLADPQSIISIFWVDESLQSDIYLDGVITVVDANASRKGLEPTSPLHSLAVKQIALADRILLNKCDLLAEQEADEVELAIKEINKAAPIFRTVRSEMDVDKLLRIHAFDTRSGLAQENHLGPRDSLHFHLDDTVTTITLILDQPVNAALLKQWLANLLWENLLWEGRSHRMEIWRLKGKINCSNETSAVFLQGVSELFDLIQTKEAAPDQSKIVAIGRFLDAELLQASLDRMLRCDELEPCSSYEFRKPLRTEL